MSNRLFQNVIHQMKAAVDRVIGVIDENRVCVTSSHIRRIWLYREDIHIVRYRPAQRMNI